MEEPKRHRNSQQSLDSAARARRALPRRHLAESRLVVRVRVMVGLSGGGVACPRRRTSRGRAERDAMAPLDLSKAGREDGEASFAELLGAGHGHDTRPRHGARWALATCLLRRGLVAAPCTAAGPLLSSPASPHSSAIDLSSTTLHKNFSFQIGKKRNDCTYFFRKKGNGFVLLDVRVR